MIRLMVRTYLARLQLARLLIIHWLLKSSNKFARSAPADHMPPTSGRACPNRISARTRLAGPDQLGCCHLGLRRADARCSAPVVRLGPSAKWPQNPTRSGADFAAAQPANRIWAHKQTI